MKSKLGRPPKYNLLLDEIESMQVGDCLRWKLGAGWNVRGLRTVLSWNYSHDTSFKLRTVVESQTAYIVRVR